MQITTYYKLHLCKEKVTLVLGRNYLCFGFVSIMVTICSTGHGHGHVTRNEFVSGIQGVIYTIGILTISLNGWITLLCILEHGT